MVVGVSVMHLGACGELLVSVYTHLGGEFEYCSTFVYSPPKCQYTLVCTQIDVDTNHQVTTYSNDHA